MRSVFRWFEKVNLWQFIIQFFIFTLVVLLICFKFKRLFKFSIPFCIATTGFAGMIFDLVLIFAFQILYGYVFYQIGLLVTAFMFGAITGSLLMTRSMGRIKKDLVLFLKLETAIVIFSALLPLIFLKFSHYLDRPIIFLTLQIVFFILSFISGFLIGSQFPLANKIYLETSSNLSSTAGLLYAADLFGGWIGGIIGGVVLLPFLGLLGTCMVVVMLKVISFVILAISARKQI